MFDLDYQLLPWARNGSLAMRNMVCFVGGYSLPYLGCGE
jgi:hypothetical protein